MGRDWAGLGMLKPKGEPSGSIGCVFTTPLSARELTQQVQRTKKKEYYEPRNHEVASTVEPCNATIQPLQPGSKEKVQALHLELWASVQKEKTQA